MPALDDATGVLAHEARNVLTATRGRLHLLRRKTERGEVDCARFIDTMDGIDGGLRRLGELIDTLEAGAHPVPVLSSPVAGDSP